MASLTRFDQDGLELFINEQTGESFASQRGLARMCGVAHTTIARWASGASIRTLEAEVLTPRGVQTANLMDEDSIYEALCRYQPELLVQCAKAGLRIYLHGLAGFKYVVETAESSRRSTLDFALAAIDMAFANVDIKPELVAGVKLNAAVAIEPAAKPAIEEARKFLAATTTIEDQLLTPTELGERLGVSARRVNTLLIERGLQVKNTDRRKGAPAYTPTDRGREFCEFTIATGRGKDNTSFQHLKWYLSVIDQLMPATNSSVSTY